MGHIVQRLVRNAIMQAVESGDPEEDTAGSCKIRK